MNPNWNTYKLGELGEFFGGVTSIKKEDYGFGTPFIPYKNVYKNSKINISELELMNVNQNDLKKRNAVYGDIFFTASSETPDEVAISSVLLDGVENLTYNGFCKRLRLNNFETLLPEFARYYFKSDDFRTQVYQLKTGDVRFNISQESLAKINITIPGIAEQRRIAEILTSLDDKIELNNQMNQTLESIAQAIFKEWFVDFRFPGFDGEFEDGLPNGWRKESIDKHIDFLNGIALQKYPAENEEDYLPVIKIRELRQGITQSTNKASINIPAKYIIHDGDVLFSWSGSLDVVIWTNGKGALNQHLFKVSSELYPKWFYYFWVKENLPKYQKIAANKATTMGHIQRKHLTETMIKVPSEKIFEEANKILTPLLAKFIENSVQNMTLVQLRDNLLQKLMSGKIKVKI